MPKQRQIPHLQSLARADGQVAWHWKPSKTLRGLGFVNVALGTDFAVAAPRAIELNAQVAAHRVGHQPDAPVARTLPRIVRFAELVTRYRASPAFTDLKPKSRANYDTRLRQLHGWALDGALPVRDIDDAMVTDLYDALVPVSRHRATDTIRVLRLLLAWAVRPGRIIATNPASSLGLKAPPARTTQMDDTVRTAIVASAEALGLDDVALAVPLAFWLLQRQGDLLALDRWSFREVDQRVAAIAPEHAARLVDSRGRIWSFRLRQAKTGAPVDAPLPPFLAARVADRLRRDDGGKLFAHAGSAATAGRLFRRRFEAARDAAAAVAICEGDVAAAETIAAVQFRDLRRTGMTFYGHAGAKLNWITALSGHAVLGKKSILDVYMPPDTASAAACVATGLAAIEAAQAREAV